MPFFGSNIAGLKQKRDVTGLIQFLKSKDRHTRTEAIKALGELGDARAVPTLGDLLAAPEQPIGDLIHAANALGKIDDATTVAVLQRAVRVSRQREQDLIDLARAAPERRYRDGFYVNRISTDEYELRTTIADAFANLATVDALHALFEMLANETGAMESSIKSQVRVCIERACTKLGARAAPVLCNQLRHHSIEVRQWSAQNLIHYPERPVIDALTRAACDDAEVYDVRVAALTTLSNIGDEPILPAIDELVTATNKSLAREAKQCAIAIRQRLGLPFITGFGSNNPLIR